MFPSQKAPSAKRCIKTVPPFPCRSASWPVRKHRAPKGALRPTGGPFPRVHAGRYVRKHRAPKGALRRLRMTPGCPVVESSQKAPSAKRCINTVNFDDTGDDECDGQKAPSAKRCIKTFTKSHTFDVRSFASESTERQKVH